MKNKNIWIIAGIGLLLGYIINKKQSSLTPEKALHVAKETFEEHTPINGSWIYTETKRFEKNGITYEAYKGGISRNIDGENKQYTFIIDKHTGAIIEAEPILAA